MRQRGLPCLKGGVGGGKVRRMRWREAGNTGRKMDDIMASDESALATHK